MPYVLTCQSALRACVLTCSRVVCTYVLTCLVCFRAHIPTCLVYLRAHALRALRAHVLYVPTCSRTIATNKDKFSIICFPYILVIFLCFFPVKWNCCTFLHFSYQSEAFNWCYDKLCTIKWFDFCLSITLRVIFKWLIKGERWIIFHGS